MKVNTCISISVEAKEKARYQNINVSSLVDNILLSFSDKEIKNNPKEIIGLKAIISSLKSEVEILKIKLQKKEEKEKPRIAPREISTDAYNP